MQWIPAVGSSPQYIAETLWLLLMFSLLQEADHTASKQLRVCVTQLTAGPGSVGQLPHPTLVQLWQQQLVQLPKQLHCGWSLPCH
jgi:hypothetical protein